MIDFNAANKPRKKTAVQASPLDIEPIKKRFEAVKKKIDDMVTESGGHEVKDSASEIKGVEMASQAKKLWKSIDNQRKEWKKPANEFNKSVENLCQVYMKPLLEIETHQKQIGGAYQTRLILAQREADAKAKAAAEKVQAEINKEAKAKNIEPPQMPAPVAREPEKTKRTEEGSMTYISKHVPTIMNSELVPDEYMIIVRAVDLKKVKEAIAAGVREIPGIQIDEIQEARLRT